MQVHFASDVDKKHTKRPVISITCDISGMPLMPINDGKSADFLFFSCLHPNFHTTSMYEYICSYHTQIGNKVYFRVQVSLFR